MKKILKYDAIEYAKDQRDFSQKIFKISKNYNYYLKNMKLNSKILKKILQNDPLRKTLIDFKYLNFLWYIKFQN